MRHCCYVDHSTNLNRNQGEINTGVYEQGKTMYEQTFVPVSNVEEYL